MPNPTNSDAAATAGKPTADKRKLFDVSIEVSVLVLANDAEHARTIVSDRRALHEEMQNIYEGDYSVGRAHAIPDAWDESAYVIHDGTEEITVADALKIDPYMNEHFEHLQSATAKALKDFKDSAAKATGT
jgi:hypothetical protein